ncbi:glycosyltransferase [Leuconostoc pseudomesenteroides]|uniref:Glycosyltransferase n=1 Tax=Leuconostoc pseudomesenteroides TaxID=33968 RepID=A0ABT6HB80_LEUPS|nr:glycosyltransferase [Leuconostoc pseudomesenteroides]MDG9733344.1 glycosyltransferase [Leuconostoc pseudomesenteroides]
MLAAKANMIQQFNHRNIKILQSLGYEVHVATNMVDFGSMSTDENERFKIWMSDNNIIAHQVDFERRMGTLKGNIRSIRQLREIFKTNDFSFIHVHSPLGSILGRFVAKQFKVPAIYTAHGFHFFKGGPKSGWIVFYPLEWLFSFFTDTLITINDEDYALAKKHMHANKVVKINGIGVDVKNKWLVTDAERKNARHSIRQELNIPEDAFLLSSVGELSDRKNHRVVLEALRLMSDDELSNIYYVIAGTGNNGDLLRNFAQTFNFENHFHLLGYRSDIDDINYASDVSIFPSLREGLGVAGLDATVDGTYLLGTKKRGVSDYIRDDVNGNLFAPDSPEELNQLIRKCLMDTPKTKHFDFLKCFDYGKVDKVMTEIYGGYE